LANDLGNLLNRVVSMIQRYRNGIVPTPGEIGAREVELQRLAGETLQRVKLALDHWEIGNALNAIWNFVRRANQYIEQSEPWKLARQAEATALLDTVLFTATEAVRLLGIYLAPFLPSASNRLLEQLGMGPMAQGDWQTRSTWGGEALHQVSMGTVLFPRIE